MVSEYLRLTDAEFAIVAEVACSASGSAPAVISVGAESTFHAQQRARIAKSVGAAALMAIPPIGNRLSDDELFGYYAGIITAADLPFVVQDASGYVGQPLTLSLQKRLLDAFPELVMFKPEAPPIAARVSALRDATDGRAQIFEGTGGLALVDSFRRGIIGTMPGADFCWAVVKLWSALQREDDDAIYALNEPMISIVSMQTSLDAFLAIEKHLLQRQGVFSSTRVRGPVGYEFDAESRVEVDRLFDRLKVAADGVKG
jgi:4-hydroxy-tetrahydrodipicolinate synthase